MASRYASARDDLRQAAFARLHLLEQVYGADIPGSAISHGFACNDEKVLFANRAVDIFKSKQMRRGALSIKTLFTSATRPRAGRQNIYADAEGVYLALFPGFVESIDVLACTAAHARRACATRRRCTRYASRFLFLTSGVCAS